VLAVVAEELAVDLLVVVEEHVVGLVVRAAVVLEDEVEPVAAALVELVVEVSVELVVEVSVEPVVEVSVAVVELVEAAEAIKQTD
jgi:hypothetical protein